jgi:NADH-quinone oxidoreductase subunit H
VAKNMSDYLDRLIVEILRRFSPPALEFFNSPGFQAWKHWIYAALLAVVTIIFISLSAMYLIWLERKVCAKIQRRMGPMTTGPQWGFYKKFLLINNWWTVWWGGLLQTLMDTIKLLLKEDIIPSRADRIIFISAPFVMMMACFGTFLVIPFGPGLIVRDLNIGILYLMAVMSLSVIAIIMGGWGSNNKYALLGGIRSAAQIISYEVPMLFSLLSVIILSGSLSMGSIVDVQQHAPGLGWFIFPLFIGFVVYMISAVAETNRPPFDIPEAESELVAGFSIEYSGIRFSMFFLAEFMNMFVVAAIATTVFLGGWTLPFGIDLRSLLTAWHFPFADTFALLGAVFIFFVKTYFLIFFMMWTRWTFPRLRGDQLMGFGWKVLLPFSLVNLLIACLWAMTIMT